MYACKIQILTREGPEVKYLDKGHKFSCTSKRVR